MNRKIALLIAAALIAPALAQASSVGVNSGLSRTPATDGYPGGGSSRVGVTAAYDLSERWTFDLGFGLSRPKADPITSGPLAGKTKEATVASLSLGSSWSPDFAWNSNNNWSFSLDIAASPKATELSSTTVTLEQQTRNGVLSGEAETLLKSVTSSAGFSLSASYDTMGDSNWETAIDLSVSPNRLATTQSVQEMVTAQGTTVTREKLAQDCATTQPKQLKLKKTCERLNPLLGQQEESVVTVPISLSIDETIYQNTEVSVSGTYYWYSSDPNDIGYFTLASAGRPLSGTTTKAPANTASFGTGVAIAPYTWSTAIAAAHKLGPVKITATLGRAVYLDDAGHNNSIGLRAAWKISSHWRLTGGFSSQEDVDADDVSTRSYSGTAAVKYTF